MSIEETEIVDENDKVKAPIDRFFSTEGVPDIKCIHVIEDLWRDYEKGERDNPPNKNQLVEKTDISRRQVAKATKRLEKENLIEEENQDHIGILRLTTKGRMAYKLIEPLFADIEKIVKAIDRLAFHPDSSQISGEEIKKEDVERELGKSISDDVFRYAEKIRLEHLRNHSYEKSGFVEDTEEELEEMFEDKSE
ncbi:MAG: hypothetical protein ABEJ95_07595 [Candidatus Nanohalobium sp.]